MFCTECGVRSAEDAIHCPHCGRRLNGKDARASAPDRAALPASEENKGSLLLLSCWEDDRSALHSTTRSRRRIRQNLSSRNARKDDSSLRDAPSGETELMSAVVTPVPRAEERLAGPPQMIVPAVPAPIPEPQAARPLLLRSPLFTAALASAVTLLLALVGVGMGWFIAQSRHAAIAPGKRVASSPAQAASIAHSPIVNRRPAAAKTGKPLPEPAPPAASSSSAAPTPAVQAALPPTQIAPAAKPKSRAAREAAPAETFILPDRNGESDTGAARSSTAPDGSASGHFEIVVSNGEVERAKAARKAEAETESRGSSGESRSARAAAQQLQIQGDYRRAITEYVRALDGAGEEKGRLHQEIAVCFQRLEDKESAIAHYNNAITHYKAQIAAGRGAESARNGIKTSEAGIRACR